MCPSISSLKTVWKIKLIYPQLRNINKLTRKRVQTLQVGTHRLKKNNNKIIIIIIRQKASKTNAKPKHELIQIHANYTGFSPSLSKTSKTIDHTCNDNKVCNLTTSTNSWYEKSNTHTHTSKQKMNRNLQQKKPKKKKERNIIVKESWWTRQTSNSKSAYSFFKLHSLSLLVHS